MQIQIRTYAGFALMAAAACAFGQTAAPITAVTLYPGSATIVRTARVEAGANRLVIPDLTTLFASETLRVDADPGIRVGQVVIQDAGRSESSNPAEAGLEARIQALKDQAAMLDVDAGAADIVKAYLERVGGDAGASPDRPHNNTSDAKALTAMVGAIAQAAADALGKKQQVALQKREIQKKIDALERDLQRTRSDSRDRRTVTISLAAERAGLVRLSYQAYAAGWKPSYRAELDSAGSTVVLERLAQVSQKTGEDWKAVKIHLSTSQPRAMTPAITPQPWLLTYVPPRPAEDSSMARYAPAAPAPVARPVPAPMASASAQAAYVPPTFQSDGSFATEFIVPTPVSLPSDGREVSLALAKQSLKVKQRSQVTPRLGTTAVVTAEAERPNGVWPAGNVQLYRDANFVGSAHWAPQASEKFKFAFGPDDLLHVKLDPIKGDSGTVGAFEKRNQRQIADQITVRSAHAKPINVLIIEATPVSTSEEIRVQASFDPKPTIQAVEQRRGVVAWEQTVGAHETSRIDLRYTIEYPKEGSVRGLR